MLEILAEKIQSSFVSPRTEGKTEPGGRFRPGSWIFEIPGERITLLGPNSKKVPVAIAFVIILFRIIRGPKLL